jgi:hypothetical protein
MTAKRRLCGAGRKRPAHFAGPRRRGGRRSRIAPNRQAATAPPSSLSTTIICLARSSAFAPAVPVLPACSGLSGRSSPPAPPFGGRARKRSERRSLWPKRSTRSRTTTPKPSLYEEITTQIIAELEAGVSPWARPWGCWRWHPSGLRAAAECGHRQSLFRDQYPDPVGTAVSA